MLGSDDEPLPPGSPLRSDVSWNCTSRECTSLESESLLMDRPVVLTWNMYRLLSATPARPATSRAIRLASVSANGRATHITRPTLPIFFVVPLGLVGGAETGWRGGRGRPGGWNRARRVCFCVLCKARLPVFRFPNMSGSVVCFSLARGEKKEENKKQQKKTAAGTSPERVQDRED